MRSIPREPLEMLGHGMKSVDYGGGSIEKLDLITSRGVMNEGEHLLQIPHQILQNIESLILTGSGTNQRGFENLAECIPYLHSLTSLDIGKNPGGDGSLVRLLQALRRHEKLQTLYMSYIYFIGMDDLAALADLIQTSSSLRELEVGGCTLVADVVQQLLRTVLSPSSLNTVTIHGREHPLDGIETISVSISSLSFYHPPLYISQLPADKQRTLFGRYSTSMNVVWRFVAGLTTMHNIGWDEFKQSSSDYKVEDNVLIVLPILLECFYEAQDVQSCESAFGQHRVRFSFLCGMSNYGFYALGHCISVCSCTHILLQC